MILNMTGGAALNFKVVGSAAEPANPAENTIWVNTDAAVTGWAFRADQPESPSEGEVWFYTGTSGQTQFNAVRKNAIIVCPLSCKQYIAGAWADKTAKSYINGAWLDWVTFLYNSGKECTDLTGGWITSQTCNGTITKNAADITADCAYNADKDTYFAIYTTNKVDVSDASKLTINSDWLEALTGGSWTHVKLGLYANAPTSATPTAIASIENAGNMLDLSSISGSYYVAIHGWFYSNGGTAKVVLKELTLE